MHYNLSQRASAPFRLHSLAVALASASASTPALAQEQPGVLQTIKVNADADSLYSDMPEADGLKADFQRSATKMPLSVRETPQAVSVITRKSLDIRQVQTLGQALELSGAAQTSGNGPFGGQSTFGFNMTTIRGMSIDDEYDFRDDGFISGSYFSQPDLAIYDRVEVAKGPNSVLYGRGSVGGLINRIRKKPLLEARTELQASVGSYDSYRLDADTTGPINKSKTVRGRFVGAYEDEGSFVAGAKTERTVAAPSIEFDVAERTHVLVQGLYQNEEIIPSIGMALQPTGYDADGNVTDYDAPDINRSQFNGVPNRKPYTWRVKTLLAQLDHEFNDDWFATLRLSKNKIDTPNHGDSYVYGFYDGGDDPTTVVVERYGDTSLVTSDFFIERDIWAGEIQLNGRFDVAGHEIKVTVGADHDNNDYTRRGIYYDPVSVDSAGNTFNFYEGNFERIPRGEADQGASSGGDPSSNGAYVQAQISATERLKVLLGARYDKVELRSFSGEVSDSDTVSDSTGRIGVTYELNRNIELYALYAQSFQPVLFSFDAEGRLLDPETGEGKEVGAKTDWLDGKLAATLAIYQVERNDVAVAADTPPDEEDYSIPGGSQRARGFEIEINGRPLPGWDISLSYNNVDSKYRNPELAYSNAFADAPDWQLGLFTSYEIQTGPLQGLGFGVTRFEIDERGVSTWQPGTLPGYERYDLHAFYKGIDDVEINLTVRNVTDEIYVEGADRGTSYAQFGSPTAALLSVKYIIN